jgi:hypothetical protein
LSSVEWDQLPMSVRLWSAIAANIGFHPEYVSLGRGIGNEAEINYSSMLGRMLTCTVA